jgi:hypothetical protein
MCLSIAGVGNCAAYQFLPPAVCCLADGSVHAAGVPVQGTRRCSHAAHELSPPAEEDAACDVTCPEAVRIVGIRDGRIGKRELELVVSRSVGEEMSWCDAYDAVLRCTVRRCSQ